MKGKKYSMEEMKNMLMESLGGIDDVLNYMNNIKKVFPLNDIDDKRQKLYDAGDIITKVMRNFGDVDGDIGDKPSH